jgi:hypothetical protein
LKKDVGYVEDSLSLLKCSVKKVTPTQVAGRESIITLPNTRESQDQLMTVASGSQYFSITQGGAVMTSSDMILALERKQMLVEAEKLEKKKVKIIAWKKNAKKARTLLSSRQDDKDYGKKDLEALIKYKLGPFGNEALSKLGKGHLLKLWKQKYKAKKVPSYRWTDQHESHLRKLKNGEVTRLEDCESIKRAIKTNTDFLVTRLGVLPLRRSIDVYNRHLSSLSPEQRQEVLSAILSFATD